MDNSIVSYTAIKVRKDNGIFRILDYRVSYESAIFLRLHNHRATACNKYVSIDLNGIDIRLYKDIEG